LEVVNDIPQRVPGLEEAGTLHDDNRPRAAEHQPCGHADRLPLAAGSDQLQTGRLRQRRLPRTDEAVRDPDDVRKPRLGDVSNGSGGVEHWSHEGAAIRDQETVTAMAPPRPELGTDYPARVTADYVLPSGPRGF